MFRGCLLPGGCLLRGVSAPRGCVCSQGVCLLPGGVSAPRGCVCSWGVCSGGVLPGGCLLLGGACSWGVSAPGGSALGGLIQGRCIPACTGAVCPPGGQNHRRLSARGVCSRGVYPSMH